MGLENPIHIMIILAVVLMVFGAKRLPEMGRGLGDGMRGFKEAISGTTPPAQTLTPAAAQLDTTVIPAPEATPVAAATTAPVLVGETVA